jgi:hypothetical protein
MPRSGLLTSYTELLYSCFYDTLIFPVMLFHVERFIDDDVGCLFRDSIDSNLIMCCNGKRDLQVSVSFR